MASKTPPKSVYRIDTSENCIVCGTDVSLGSAGARQRRDVHGKAPSRASVASLRSDRGTLLAY